MILRYQDVCLFDSGWNLDQDVSAHLLDVLIWLPVRTTAHPMLQLHHCTSVLFRCVSISWIHVIIGISWTYLGHILGMSWEYLDHITGILLAYLGHILSIFWPFWHSPSASNLSIFGIFSCNLQEKYRRVKDSCTNIMKTIAGTYYFLHKMFFSIFGDYNDFCAMVYRI